MTRSFWSELPAPFFVLAPMEDVTDTIFREIVLRISDPAHLRVVFGEFASTDGLVHPEGRFAVATRLLVTGAERALLRATGVRIVAQIWGRDPEHFRRAAEIITRDHEFDGIDINFGCPVRKIAGKQAACSALIGDPDLACEIVRATRDGTHLPVSVKTRTGLREPITEEWIGRLLETGPAAITLHGRTQRDMTKVPADWNEIGKAVRLRDAMGSSTVMIGNGDVTSVAQGRALAARHGVEGVMVGRGVFQNAWLFNDPPPDPDCRERLALLWQHTERYLEVWDGVRNFNNLKKFYKIYCTGFPGAATLRAELMQADGADAVRRLLPR
ncbi:MAG: tRNA-dihydrouridine synthase [Candidatus Krumholzibacteriia bacterium]